jgi:hypothetical protein
MNSTQTIGKDISNKPIGINTNATPLFNAGLVNDICWKSDWYWLDKVYSKEERLHLQNGDIPYSICY